MQITQLGMVEAGLESVTPLDSSGRGRDPPKQCPDEKQKPWFPGHSEVSCSTESGGGGGEEQVLKMLNRCNRPHSPLPSLHPSELKIHALHKSTHTVHGSSMCSDQDVERTQKSMIGRRMIRTAGVSQEVPFTHHKEPRPMPATRGATPCHSI